MERDNLIYWIWYSCACETATSKTDALTERFHCDARAIWEADRSTYEACGFCTNHLEALCNKDLSEAEAIAAYCEKQGISVLTQDRPEYPSALRRIMTRPILLYMRGTLPDLDKHLCIAMVGTRRMTGYGKEQAYKIAFDLARNGACVVSGMAKGIDGVSHRGCLDGGGKTVAVLGCGVDVCYPPIHAGLMREIAANGAVLSEYKPGRRPGSTLFPARNRIISGLAAGTLVVEAGVRSGAIITAKRALAQGRDLFALPGNVGELNSVGTNQLIRDGARSIASAADILEPYIPLFSAGVLERIPYEAHRPVWNETAKKKAPSAPSHDANGVSPNVLHALNGKERAVYEKLACDRAVSADELVGRELTLVDVMTACTMLEIKGLIEGVPGGMYRRKTQN